MIPRLDISFPLERQWQYYFGREYEAREGEYLLNHARSGIVMALRTCLPDGGEVGVVAYNCHTVANSVVSAGCVPVFLDVEDGLTISLDQQRLKECEAIIVTNLFGVRNDIAAIRSANPDAMIIVENAHGYGLPSEGDFTVYSINQGKYPSLGEGGLLEVCNAKYLEAVQRQYDLLPGYSVFEYWKLFATMIIKAIMYRPWIYEKLTLKLKSSRANNADHSPVVLRRMCKGVSRMYNAWLEEHKGQELSKPFMDIIRTDNPNQVIEAYRAKGVEVATHFKNCIDWDKEFGYEEGMCPNAERLVNQLVMVPNYYKEEE